MAYPWYATGIRVAGSRQVAAVTVVKHYETHERRFKLDVLINGRVRSATLKRLCEIQEAAEKIMQKYQTDDDLIRADVRELEERLGRIEEKHNG